MTTQPQHEPKTIHGYPVVACSPTPGGNGTRPGWVVLVDKPNEFVTAWYGDGDNEWCCGHYFRKDSGPAHDYAARVARGY